MEGINNLERKLNEMMNLIRSNLNPIDPQNPGLLVPSASSSRSYTTQISEPHLASPEVFKGDADQWRHFPTQCEIHFQLQLTAFPSEQAKLVCVISLLSGKPK